MALDHHAAAPWPIQGNGTRTPGPMPLGFGGPHPGGMADNSPTFQRWDHDNSEPSPEGTAETMHRVSRPFGTYARRTAVPNVETDFSEG